MNKQTKIYSNSLTMELSGIINCSILNIDIPFEKIKLLQSNNYQIDLINRFEEIKESFGSNSKLQVNYWISNFYKINDIYPNLNEYSDLTKEEKDIKNKEIFNQNFSKELVQELWLNQLYNGKLITGYEQVKWGYSEWTSGTDYNSYLKIGGHDLFQELSQKQGEFLLLEINIEY